jgi:hypothetical protein
MICGDDHHHEYMGTKKELMREMTNHVRFEGLFFMGAVVSSNVAIENPRTKWRL